MSWSQRRAAVKTALVDVLQTPISATWSNTSAAASSWANTVPLCPTETRMIPGSCALNVPSGTRRDGRRWAA